MATDIRNFVDKGELEAEYNKCRENGWQWTERFGELLIKLHRIVLNKPNFHNYPEDFKQELMSYSFQQLFKFLPNYKKEKGDFYPYIYTAIHLNFWQFCKQWYKKQNRYYQYIYDQLLEFADEGKLTAEQKEIIRCLEEDPYIKVQPRTKGGF